MADVTNWADWNRCPICGVRAGVACRARSGRIVDGHPDAAPVALDVAHRARRRRKQR